MFQGLTMKTKTTEIETLQLEKLNQEKVALCLVGWFCIIVPLF